MPGGSSKEGTLPPPFSPVQFSVQEGPCPLLSCLSSQHINELTMKMNMNDILCRAEALYRQLAATPVRPQPAPPAPQFSQLKPGSSPQARPH